MVETKRRGIGAAAALVTLLTGPGAMAQPEDPTPAPAVRPAVEQKVQAPPLVPDEVRDFLDGQRREASAVDQARQDLRKKTDELGVVRTGEAAAARLVARRALEGLEGLVGRLAVPGPPLDKLPEIGEAQKALARVRDGVESVRTRVAALDSLADAAVPEAVNDVIARIEATAKRVKRIEGLLAKAVHTLEGQLASVKGLVVSGGVSLGAYQAGFLHYYTQHLLAYDRFIRQAFPGQRDESFGRFQLATGASAGSINALLSLLAGCLEPVRVPEQSLFYRSWIDVGIRDLVRIDQMKFDGMFSRGAIDDAADRLKLVLDGKSTEPGVAWSSEPCVAHLGITATRMRARRIPMSQNTVAGDGPSISLARQTEKLMFQIRREPGEPAARILSFRPVDAAGNPVADEIYPTLGDGSGASEPGAVVASSTEMMKLLEASSAFPLAFSPERLTLTAWRRLPDRSFAKTTTTEGVTDGGFLDNTPLRLAVKMHATIQALSRRESAAPPPLPPAFLFMSSGNTAWKRASTRVASAPARPEPPREVRSIFGEYLPFLFQLLDNASDAELMDVLESHPEIRRELPARGMPVAGEQLVHFFAFADVAFRRSDFFQGMVDAYLHLARDAGDLESAVVAVDSDIFGCFLAYRRSLGGVEAPVPEPADLDACKPVAQRRADRNLLRVLRASARYRQWAELDWDEAREFSRFLDLLDEEQFTYTDLRQFGSPSSRTVPRILRSIAQDVVQGLGEKQEDFGSRWGVWIPGKLAANRFLYLAPSHLYLAGDLTGGAEIGGGLVLARWAPGFGDGTLPLALRLQPGVRLFGLESEYSPSGSRYSVTTMPYAGALLEFGGQTLQFEIGAGAAVKHIWAVRAHELMMWRWGPELLASLGFYQRLVLFAAVTHYLDHCSGANAACEHAQGIYRTGDFAPIDPKEVWNLEWRIGIALRFLR